MGSQGFPTIPNVNLQAQQPMMDSGANPNANQEWEQDNVILNRQAQMPPAPMARGFGGADPSAMLGAPAGAPIPSSYYMPPGQSPQNLGFGGSNPYGQGFQGIDPRTNPYFQPIPTTVDGRAPYDPVQLISGRQQSMSAQYASQMAQARKRDNSPLGFMMRGLQGATGRPVTSAQQRVAASFGLQRQMADQDQQNLLKAVAMNQMSPQDYAKSMEQMAGQWNAGAHQYDDAQNGYLGNYNKFADDNASNAIKSFGAQSQERHWGRQDSNADAVARNQLQKWNDENSLGNRRLELDASRQGGELGFKKQQLAANATNQAADRELKRQLAAAEQGWGAGNSTTSGAPYAKYKDLLGPTPTAPTNSDNNANSSNHGFDPIASVMRFGSAAPQMLRDGGKIVDFMQNPPVPAPHMVKIRPAVKRGFTPTSPAQSVSAYPLNVQKAIDHFNALPPAAKSRNRAAFQQYLQSEGANYGG